MILLVVLATIVICVAGLDAKYFSVSMHEVNNSALYLSTTTYGEIIVNKAGRGLDFNQNDYITHADGTRLIAGGLDTFWSSGESEIVVPIVDGAKLIGFVKLLRFYPSKISARRGDIEYDMEEGGPPPTLQLGNVVISSSGVHSTTSSDYTPPPHGGGKCITGRDCYNNNGTCSLGLCSCLQDHTGSYCQLYRPDRLSLSDMINSKIDHNNEDDAISKPKRNIEDLDRQAREKMKKTIHIETKKKTPEVHEQPVKIATQQIDNENELTEPPTKKKVIKVKAGTKKKAKPRDHEDGVSDGNTNSSEDTKSNPSSTSSTTASKDNTRTTSNNENEQRHNKRRDDNHIEEPKQPRVLTYDDLYGPNKPYPEPYAAGKVPAHMVHHRSSAREKGYAFRYSVSFRQSPFGFVLDNRLADKSIVEKVLHGQQADHSDINQGDQVIAVDIHNTTTLSAATTTRILQSLSWPKVIVFETAGSTIDPVAIEKKKRESVFNVTILYPPTLNTLTLSLNAAEWSPNLALEDKGDAYCPIFKFTAPDDLFGCEKPDDDKNQYQLTDALNELVANQGAGPTETVDRYPMSSMLLRESQQNNIDIDFKSVAIVKRGVCTFVNKAVNIVSGGASLGLVVNTDDTSYNMPAGKENTSNITSTIGLVKEKEGTVLFNEALKGEVLAVISSADTGYAGCSTVTAWTETILDSWPYNVPNYDLSDVLKKAHNPKKKVSIRGNADEGGRIVVSGENGWVYFDYHLALFGPQEVPLEPLKLVLAKPIHGCDPNAYTVRITGGVVAVLRGGGCSFGIKVINAQTLGAKAVIIINTDNVETMRLNALADEIPLINIPVIMVSRRLQYYLEEKLTKYHVMDQFVVTIQPTGLFHNYELDNTMPLPARVQIKKK